MDEDLMDIDPDREIQMMMGFSGFGTQEQNEKKREPEAFTNLSNMPNAGGRPAPPKARQGPNQARSANRKPVQADNPPFTAFTPNPFPRKPDRLPPKPPSPIRWTNTETWTPAAAAIAAATGNTGPPPAKRARANADFDPEDDEGGDADTEENSDPDPGPGPGPGFPDSRDEMLTNASKRSTYNAQTKSFEPRQPHAFEDKELSQIGYTHPTTGVSFTKLELRQFARGEVVDENGDKVYFKPSFVDDDPWSHLRDKGEKGNKGKGSGKTA